MCYHFLVPYICIDLSIEGQLEHLSYTAHLTLALYIHNKACNNFIPMALYFDLILMVKNIFFALQKLKSTHPTMTSALYYLGLIILKTSLAACKPS